MAAHWVCAALLTLCALTGCPAAPEPPGPAVDIQRGMEMLKTLRPGHPRLICTDADLQRVRNFIATNSTAKAWADHVIQEAEKLVATEDTVAHKLIGPRLLSESRKCLDRVYTLGLAFRLTGERKYADRALKEMLTAAAFKDWNPSHFLDTAEMTHALGVGYDWLYGVMTQEQKTAVREAIVKLGLLQGKKVYDSGGGWSKNRNNWNQVCNGGMTIGALAIADEEPAIAAEILQDAVASIPNSLRSYAPDGGWEEGPGYWHYATRYTVYMLTALLSALGTDFGLSNYEGMDNTGFFRMHFAGPTGKSFNYADGGETTGTAAEMLWLAQRYNHPVFAWHERQIAGNVGSPWHLIWFTPIGQDPVTEKTPTAAAFRRINVAFMRSAWNDPDAIFVGFKGGDNRAGHSHLDLGCFVLDALGQRWATDLGSDDYNLPAYFGSKRWTYYRLRTESHNTLLINNENQDPSAKAPLVGFQADPELSYAVADMKAAYKGLKNYLRGVALVKKSAVLVQDDLQAEQPVEALWGMVTTAEVTCDGAKATLTQKGKTLQARILSPEGARFDTVSTQPPPPQKQNTGTRKLVVRLAGPVAEVRIAVLLWPGTGEPPAVTLRPLSEWIKQEEKK